MLVANIYLIINWDIELFFLELFHKKTNILEIPNIIFREDNWNIHFNKEDSITNDLWEYIIWAYYNGYYTNFFKNKVQKKLNIKLRDAIINYCKSEQTISSKLDGRITKHQNE